MCAEKVTAQPTPRISPLPKPVGAAPVINQMPIVAMPTGIQNAAGGGRRRPRAIINGTNATLRLVRKALTASLVRSNPNIWIVDPAHRSHPNTSERHTDIHVQPRRAAGNRSIHSSAAAVKRQARSMIGPNRAPDASPTAWFMPSPAALAQVKEPPQAIVASKRAGDAKARGIASCGSRSARVVDVWLTSNKQAERGIVLRVKSRDGAEPASPVLTCFPTIASVVCVPSTVESRAKWRVKSRAVDIVLYCWLANDPLLASLARWPRAGVGRGERVPRHFPKN
jgi:hypothetical protein